VSRVVVVGAGGGGLVAALRCAQAGHDVTVLEATAAAGGKAGRLEAEGYGFDTGPSLLTMPWLFEDLLGDTIELVRVEPVTRYRFADGSALDLSADLPRAMAALEAWSPGAGGDWAAFLGACAAMWRAAVPVLTGEPPWPPRRRSGAAPPDPRDLLRIRPWHTLRTLARAYLRDRRLRLVAERFATYAGADPRRAPAVLAVAGYVEHAFGAWHVRGGIHAVVRALLDRLAEHRVRLHHETPATGVDVDGGHATHVITPSGPVPCDWLVWNGDALVLDRLLGRVPRRAPEPSLSGYVLLAGLPDRTPGLPHHTIVFPRSYDDELDDVFVRRRPVRDPTLYVCASSVTDPGEAPDGGENRFVLVNAPAGLPERAWDGYDEHVLARLAAAGLPAGDPDVLATRTPADLERETGAIGGAIYGRAPHGRLGTLRRPGPRVRGLANVLRAGGTAHPGGGLPLVALSGELASRLVGRA
jgi:phytoene desaturase